MHSVLRPTEDMQCRVGATMREALAKISATPFVAQIVIAEDGRVVGVMTDGDVRRALLRKLNLDACVGDVMNAEPVLGRLGEDRSNAEALAATKSIVRFLPVVDQSGRLACIWTATSTQGAPVALVMAGGMGQRLGEQTRDTPKPLVPVAGKPMIEHVFTRLENAGIATIYVSVMHLADQIESYVTARQGMAEMRLVRETRKLGTAGAIGLLPPDIEGPLLVINADVMTTVTYDAMLDFHVKHDHAATIAMARYEHQLGFGLIHYDESGQFRSVEEKPTFVHFVAAGIYLIGPAVRRLAPPDTCLDMPQLLNDARRAGLRVGVFPVHEYWRDVGRPVDLASADADLRAQANESDQS